MFWPWLGLKAMALARFRAKKFGSGLAWPGFGPSHGFSGEFGPRLNQDTTPVPVELLQCSYGGPKAMAFWPGFGLNDVQARPKATPGQDSGLALALVPKPKSHGFLA
ncbi:hypothetical protein DFH06DRAFT_1128674 [Mycena polygramma]|nr:hypothetical protein DFH06DRAFT_1128674 [Mycena polygramma]